MSIKKVRRDLKLWGVIKSYEYEECGFNHVNMLHSPTPEDKEKHLQTIEFMEGMDKSISHLPDHLKSAINANYVRRLNKEQSAKWLGVPVKTFSFWLVKAENDLIRKT